MGEGDEAGNLDPGFPPRLYAIVTLPICHPCKNLKNQFSPLKIADLVVESYFTHEETEV